MYRKLDVRESHGGGRQKDGLKGGDDKDSEGEEEEVRRLYRPG